MRFAQIIKGTRARNTVTIEGIVDDKGALVPIDVRPLNGTEQSEVLAKARAFAEKQGVKDPKAGEPIYDLGIQAYTLLAATIDHDSPVDSPRPFFANVEEILDGLDRDRRSYLYEWQEAWEDQCAPRPSKASQEDFVKWCVEVCSADEGDDGPFVKLRPVLRWSYMRTLAALHVISPLPRSQPGSDTASASPTSTTPSQATE